jgi:hypothetical protein
MACASQIAISRIEAIVLLVYGDESMDEAHERVCAAAAVVGTEEQWAALESQWVICTGGIPFHANNCDSDSGNYNNIPHEQNKDLYRELTTLLAESGLCGFGAAMDLREQKATFPTFPEHWSYYKVVVDVVEFMKNCARDSDEIAEITFDNRKESEFNFTSVYANLREENPDWKEHLASKLSFDSSRKNSRIQVGDLVAREVMKDLDNRVGPVKRSTRGAWKALRDTGRFLAYNYSKDWFHDLGKDIPSLVQRAGFTRADYEAWLKERNRQHNLTAYIEFFHWHKEQREAL